MKHKKLFLLFLILFVFSFANFTNALEVPLPFMPDNPTLPQYVIYVFRFLVLTAGAISLVSFVVGSVSLIFSADDPSRADSGRDRMKGAILGLILTVSSYIILNTINPVLTRPTLTALPPGAGVFYSDGGNQRWSVASEVSDVRISAPAGATNLFYDCDGKGGGTGPALLVWQFKKPGLEGGNDLTKANVVQVPCGNPLSLNGTGSFRYDFEKPGVYYYLGKGCSGYASNSIVGSQDKISEPFNGNIESVRIVNDPDSQIYYGVIFHYEQGLSNGGECDFPIIGEGDSKCFDADVFNYQIAEMAQASADIFVVNKNAGSGNGVVFYSKPTGWDTNNQGHRQAGFLQVSDSDITKGLNNKVFWQDTKKICFNYTNIDAPDPYQYKCSGGTCGKNNKNKKCSNNACESFQDCPGSIEIKGQYLVGIYSEVYDNPLSNSPAVYCQTFTKTVPNLNVQEIVGVGDDNVGTVLIIPTK